mmetsp:Transcript_14725/g.17048  ORF Transcript_14725/g.17048 Transcript_14725/m.17048 type:complete len:85 (+) Transcript_14725:531-785(+)
MLFTLLLLFLRVDSNENYLMYMFNKKLASEFKNVEDIGELKTFILQVGKGIFVNTTSGYTPQLRRQAILVGPVRLRTQRRQEIL